MKRIRDRNLFAICIPVLFLTLFFFTLFVSAAQAGNSSPQVISVTPSQGLSAPDQQVVFTAIYSDADGYANIRTVHFLVNSKLSILNCPYVYYDRLTNRLYLRNDAGTSWLGGYSPRSSYIIENSYVKLDCSKTTVSGSGTTLTVGWALTFKSAFNGAKNAYLYAVDASAANSGWVQKGTWLINNPPRVSAISPSSGTSLANAPRSFITVYSDPEGYADMRCAYLLINTSITSSNGLYAYYNQTTKMLYLLSDNNAWLGGYAPGSANVLENSYVKIDCSRTAVSGSGKTLTINWSITFKPAFMGVKNIYMYVSDSAASSGWAQKGTWTVTQPDVTPPTGSIKINNDEQYADSTVVTLYIDAADGQGGSGVDQMMLSTDNSNWTGPEPYRLAKLFTLPAGDGTKTVYVKFCDRAGNWSGAYSDSIILDTVPPTPDFTATPISGTAPLAVQFTDKSTGNAVSYDWDFGDGQTSSEKNPAHVYILSGWDIEYSAYQLPQSTNPAWIRRTSGKNNTEVLENGILHTTSDFVEGGLNYSRSASFSGDKEYVVETRFKLGNFLFPVSYGGMSLNVNDDTYHWSLDFAPGRINIVSGATYCGGCQLDTQGDYHIYRIIAKRGIVDVYVDGVKKISADMKFTSNNGPYVPQVGFGVYEAGWGPPPGMWSSEGFWDYVKVKYTANPDPPIGTYYTVALTATGRGGADTKTVPNIIHVTAALPKILTANLPDANIGIDYEQNLNAVDGVSPYMWLIDSGDLPEGLVLDNVTGKISGKPKVSGTANFTVRVTDSNMMPAAKALSINVLPVSMGPDEQLLDETEARAALYFYNEALANGFVKDGNHKDFSSIAATGFGLASMCVMAERYGTTADWTVTPAQAKTRVNQILDECIRIQDLQTPGCNEYGTAGFLYHFITQNGTQQSGSEISTVDMALFLAGAITAGEYFGPEVKDRVNRIMAKLNWSYFLVPSKKQFSHGCYLGGSLIPGTWDRPGDEAMIVSLMALASDPENRAYLDTMYSLPRVERSYGGYNVVNSYFGSLFTYIFAHCFFDFEKLGKDNPLLAASFAEPVDWWVNSVNAVKAARQFCIDQSANYSSYGPDSWGITACEYPDIEVYAGLLGAMPCERNGGVPEHDGTIAPYGAMSCMPFMRTSPAENVGDNLAFKALKFFHNTYYNSLWGPYGPRDSFNQNGAFNPYYYGLDLGSIVIMIENYRSRLVWDNFMKSEKVEAATAKVFGQGGGIPPPVTLYVDPANSADQNQDGSQAHPFDNAWKVFNYYDANNCIIQFAPGKYEYSGITAEGKFSVAIKGVIGDRSDPLNTTVNTVFVGSSINMVQTKFASIENLVMTTCGKDYYGNQGPAGSYGGAIYAESCDSILVNNCVFLKNVAYKGSAIYSGNCKKAAISNNLFKENRGHRSGTIHIFADNYHQDWSAEISDNEIVNNSAWVCGAGIQVENNNVSINGNLVYNNTADDAAGVFLMNTQGEVKNNLIVKNYADWHGGGGLICSESPVLVTNNVIYKNRVVPKSWGGASGVSIDGVAVPTIANNIIAENTFEGIRNYGTTPITLSYNNFYGNGGGDYFGCQPGIGSISSPELFIAPDTDGDGDPYSDLPGNPYDDDYHLQSASPCINAGDPDAKFNDTDCTRNDMGIYGGPHPMPDGK